MSQKNVKQTIVHQDLALDSYLGSLLEEIPSDLPSDETVTELKQQKNNSVKAKQKVDVEEQIETKAQLKVKPLLIMPEWARTEFQAVFFKVDKLIFATPAIQMLRVIKFDKEPTKVSGQPAWFMGLLETYKDTVGVLDTRQLVLGKSKELQESVAMQSFDNVLITHDGKWGLICDEVLSIGKLVPENVRWRAIRNKRPWLIGIMIEELTTVIDLDYLVPHRKSSNEG